MKTATKAGGTTIEQNKKTNPYYEKITIYRSGDADFNL